MQALEECYESRVNRRGLVRHVMVGTMRELPVCAVGSGRCDVFRLPRGNKSLFYIYAED